LQILPQPASNLPYQQKIKHKSTRNPLVVVVHSRFLATTSKKESHRACGFVVSPLMHDKLITTRHHDLMDRIFLAKAQVYIIKTDDRANGTAALLQKIGLQDYKDKNVAIKANFNSADPLSSLNPP
jgi:hypothetical protein